MRHLLATMRNISALLVRALLLPTLCTGRWTPSFCRGCFIVAGSTPRNVIVHGTSFQSRSGGTEVLSSLAKLPVDGLAVGGLATPMMASIEREEAGGGRRQLRPRRSFSKEASSSCICACIQLKAVSTKAFETQSYFTFQWKRESYRNGVWVARATSSSVDVQSSAKNNLSGYY